jgi:hypothetical protein
LKFSSINFLRPIDRESLVSLLCPSIFKCLLNCKWRKISYKNIRSDWYHFSDINDCNILASFWWERRAWKKKVLKSSISLDCSKISTLIRAKSNYLISYLHIDKVMLITLDLFFYLVLGLKSLTFRKGQKTEAKPTSLFYFFIFCGSRVE